MEETKDFQKNNAEKEFSEKVNLDELVNSIPDHTLMAQEVEPESEKPKFEGYKTNGLLFHFLCVFGVVFLSIFFIFNVFLTPITVVGQSMLPTINAQTTSDSDDIHTDLVYYREKESYTYGDVVIISNETDHYISNENRSKRVDFLIKRIVACPGDTITFYLTDIDSEKHYYFYDIIVKNSQGEVVELNEESYIKEPMFIYYNPLNPTVFNDFYSMIIPNIVNDSITDPALRKSTITISENCYFAMGDNRNHSSDSRSFGEIMQSDICGNVRIQVKYGETVWASLFKKLKSYLSVSYIYIKENL